MNEIDYYSKGLVFHVLSERSVEDLEKNILNFLKLYGVNRVKPIYSLTLVFTDCSKEFFAKLKAKDIGDSL